ncbi:DNA gyrase subunit B, partial [mine drainage metagenome]
ADVDGSHIRTLLLTFFYRQMPELIDRGYVYIGLPPLYKLKQGKQEMYLKDDAALNAYLLNSAVEGAELMPGAGVPPIRAEALERLLHLWQQAEDALPRLSLRCDSAVLGAMFEHAPLEEGAWHDAQALQAWGDALVAGLNAEGLGRARYGFTVQPSGEHGAVLLLTRSQHGLDHTWVMARGFFASAEFRPILELSRAAHGLIEAGASIRRGNANRVVQNLAQARAVLFEEAKKGRMIQRFKGLGEMNPEQLWETTVNPETRRLLQVRIEDAISADRVFAMLMGEAVEPRREFIESNALKVANLDI